MEMFCCQSEIKKPEQDVFKNPTTVLFMWKCSILLPVSFVCGVFLSSAHVEVMALSLSCFFFSAEPPQFVKEPEKHITAEMEKVVDIPCQARGETSPDISS